MIGDYITEINITSPTGDTEYKKWIIFENCKSTHQKDWRIL